MSEATKLFVHAFEDAPSDPTDRATFLKSALKNAQATLLTSLFNLFACDTENPPILWVNTYVHAFTGGGDRRGMKIQEQVLFEPTPANEKLKDLVASVHEAIDLYIAPPNQARSMTLYLKTVSHELVYFHFDGSELKCSNANTYSNGHDLYEYARLLGLTDYPTRCYAHVAYPARRQELEYAGVYLMASNIAWWTEVGSWFAIAFYVFLLEVANAFVVDLIAQQQQQLRADQSIFDYIREPATKLADQIRALGEAAGVIQRLLVPAHHTLFKDLLSATDFFDTQKPGKDVNLSGTLTVPKFHNFVVEKTGPLFIAGVIAQVLQLMSQITATDEQAFIATVSSYFEDAKSMDAGSQKTLRALSQILAISNRSPITDNTLLESRFNILKSICHSAFKSVHSFDVNLCYGFFDLTKSRSLQSCIVSVPNRPERFLHGCLSFLEPRTGWEDSKARNRLSIVFVPPRSPADAVRLCVTSRNEYKPINDGKRLLNALMVAAGAERPRGDDKSPAAAIIVDDTKTFLYEWATSPITEHLSGATHHGDTVGSLLLVFGDLASDVCLRQDGEAVVFEAKAGRQTVTVTASGSMRQVQVEARGANSA